MLHIEDDIKVAKLPKNTVTLRVSKINTEFSYSKRVELKRVGEKFLGCFRVRPTYILFLIP